MQDLFFTSATKKNCDQKKRNWLSSMLELLDTFGEPNSIKDQCQTMLKVLNSILSSSSCQNPCPSESSCFPFWDSPPPPLLPPWHQLVEQCQLAVLDRCRMHLLLTHTLLVVLRTRVVLQTQEQQRMSVQQHMQLQALQAQLHKSPAQLHKSPAQLHKSSAQMHTLPAQLHRSQLMHRLCALTRPEFHGS
jgi:hypothetical protein